MSATSANDSASDSANATVSFSSTEREALSDLFTELGPEAPTLCDGWDTRDLAAHLIVRMTSPSALGVVASALAPLTEWDMNRVKRREWKSIVNSVRNPPFWAPLSWGPIDKRANLLEYFVHHEDVRRAQQGWTERELPERQSAHLWSALRSAAPGLFRNATTGVTLIEPGGREHIARPTAQDGLAVVISGRASELVMYAFGRTTHANVDVAGTPESLAAFVGTDLGI